MTQASTIPLWATGVTAISAVLAACVALFVGLRNSRAAMLSAQAALRTAQNAGLHRIAQSRQDWINNVMDTLSEHHSIAMTADPSGAAWPQDRRRLEYLRTKLEILLNPDEDDTRALLAEMDGVHASLVPADRDQPDAEMIRVARRLLKGEWNRIKQTLGESEGSLPEEAKKGKANAA